MKAKNKGFLMIEAVAGIWILAVFISMTAPMIKNSLKIKKSVIDETRYERNFLNVIEKMNEEINEAHEIWLRDDKKGIRALYYIYNKNDGTVSIKSIVHYFSDNFELRRYTDTEAESKSDILIEDIKGNFFQEDGFIKLKTKYKNREEEYVYRQK